MLGVAAAEGTLLRLKSWSLQMGAPPDLKGCKLRIHLLGVLLILHDETANTSLVPKFGCLEQGSVGFAEGGSLTALEAFVWASGRQAMPAVITIDIAKALFPVWFMCSRSRGAWGQRRCPPTACAVCV